MRESIGCNIKEVNSNLVHSTMRLQININLCPWVVSAESATLSIGLGHVDTPSSGAHTAADAMFQSVDSGRYEAFDTIPAGFWVGGDDAIFDQGLPNTDIWTSTVAFGIAGRFVIKKDKISECSNKEDVL
jgi:hypothetical protein